MKQAIIRNRMNGAQVLVHATTDHPDSHYGIPVWVDDDNYAYCQVGGPENPFYEVINLENQQDHGENRS